MDRVFIKEKSKELLRKNQWLCAGVAFLGALSLGAPQFNFSIPADTPEDVDAALGEIFRDIPDAFSWHLIPIIAIISLLSIVISFAIQAFVKNQFYVGSCRFFLKYRRNNPVTVSEIFQSYKDKTFLNVAKVTFLRDLFITLWSCLFVIPGIIKTYEYWAIDYILAVRPDTDREEAFSLSRRLMYGHKWDLFVLHISFYGWLLLSSFACMIPYFLYVAPYMRIAETEFFAEIRQEAINQGIITENDIPDYEDYVEPTYYYNGYTPVQPPVPPSGSNRTPAPPPFQTGTQFPTYTYPCQPEIQNSDLQGEYTQPSVAEPPQALEPPLPPEEASDENLN